MMEFTDAKMVLTVVVMNISPCVGHGRIIKIYYNLPISLYKWWMLL